MMNWLLGPRLNQRSPTPRRVRLAVESLGERIVPSISAVSAPPSAATSGTPYAGVLATFTSDQPNAQPADFSASLDWGDGSTSAGTITTASDGSFAVSGAHTYANHDVNLVQVTISDNQADRVTVGSLVNVAHAAPTLTLSGAPEIGQGFTYSLALSGTEADIAAIQSWSINWGDGTPVQTVPGNPSSVTHVYSAPGMFTASASAVDNFGTYPAGNTQQVIVVNLPPTVDVAVIYGQQTMVTLTGHVNDPLPGGLTVTFTGMVTGTAVTDANGFYTYSAPASGLGQVNVSTVDRGGLASNTAIATLTSYAPVIQDFDVSYSAQNLWVVSGKVIDESALNLIITLGNLPSLAGTEIRVNNADGTFRVTLTVAPSDYGRVLTAITYDWWNLASNLASDNVTNPNG